jgi:hypothetical protein
MYGSLRYLKLGHLTHRIETIGDDLVPGIELFAAAVWRGPMPELLPAIGFARKIAVQPEHDQS